MDGGVFRPRSWVYHHPNRLRPAFYSASHIPARATTTDTAQTLSFSKSYTIGRATEVATAGAIAFALGLATGVDTAQALSFSTSTGGVALPTLVVEIAFNAGASISSYGVVDDTTRGLVDTALVASADVGEIGGIWTDVTDYVFSGGVRRGSTRVDSPLPNYEASTCTVVLNNSDRRFDPTYLDGPYVSAGISQVTAMRAIRISAIWDDTTYRLFYGFVDAWDISWLGDSYSEAQVTATDAFKVLSGINRAAVAAVGAGEATGARVARILTSAGWPSTDRDLDTGDVTVQATTLEGDTLSELQLVAKTEIGELYINTSGSVVFRSRSAQMTDTRSAISQATFDDSGSGLPYRDLTVNNDDSSFYNKVRITRVGGAEQSASDADSITQFMERTYEASDVIMDSDAQALTYANYILARTSAPELRFDQITITPASAPGTLWPHALGRELSDRVTVVRRPPGGGHPVSRDVWIRGIEHDFEPLKWTTRFTLSRADDASVFDASVTSIRFKHRVASHWRADQRVIRTRSLPPARIGIRR